MANIIPGDSSDFAGGLGEWSSWFGCTIAHSTAQAADGTGSMEVTASSASAGIQTNNWPGFPISPSQVEHKLAVKGYKPTGSAITMEFTFHWRDDSGTDLATPIVSVAADSSGWQESSVLSTPPTGTTRIYITTDSNGTTSDGDVFYFDTIVADNEPSGGATPASVTAPAVALAFTAPAGTVDAQTVSPASVTAPPVAVGLSAPAGTVTAGNVSPASVTAPPVAVSLSAPAGSVNAGTVIAANVTAAPVQLQLSAPAGMVTAVQVIPATVSAPAVALTLTAPAGTAGEPIAARDLTILKVGTPTAKWKAGTPTSAWTVTSPKAKWQTSSPTKRWTTTAPTRTDPS